MFIELDAFGNIAKHACRIINDIFDKVVINYLREIDIKTII